MRPLLFLPFVLLLSTASLHAQKGFLLTVDYNPSITSLSSARSVDNRISLSPALQATLGYQFSKQLSMYAGVGIVERTFFSTSSWYNQHSSYTRFSLLCQYTLPVSQKASLYISMGPHLDVIRWHPVGHEPDFTQVFFKTLVRHDPESSRQTPHNWPAIGWSTAFGAQIRCSQIVSVRLGLLIDASNISPTSMEAEERARELTRTWGPIWEMRIGAQLGLRFLFAAAAKEEHS